MHFCAQKLRFAAIFAHRNALLVHLIRSWCAPRVYHLRQKRNMQPPVCKSNAQSTALTHRVGMKYTAHVVYTSSALTSLRCTVHPQFALSVHAPVQCARAAYDVSAINGSQRTCGVHCKCLHRHSTRAFFDVRARTGALCTCTCTVHCKCTYR